LSEKYPDIEDKGYIERLPRWIIPYTVAVVVIAFTISGVYYQSESIVVWREQVMIEMEQKTKEHESEINLLREEMDKQEEERDRLINEKIQYLNGRIDRKINNHEKIHHPKNK